MELCACDVDSLLRGHTPKAMQQLNYSCVVDVDEKNRKGLKIDFGLSCGAVYVVYGC